MMRILHIQAQLPSKTGSGVYFTNLIKGLENRAQQACLYGYYPDFEWGILPKDKQYQVVFPNEYCHFPLPGMSDVMPYESTIYGEMTPEMIANWKKAFEPAVHQAVADVKPDLIISHHLWFLTDLIRQWFTDIKVTGVSHGTDLRQARKHPQLAEQYTKHIKDLDMIFTLSSEHIPAIKQIYDAPEKRIHVLGSGFNEHNFYPPAAKTKDKDITIVYAGKIADSKGVFQLVDTFKNQLGDEGNIKLELYGAGDNEAVDRLKKAIESDPRITYCGVVTQDVLAEIFRKHEIFVLPSYYEGLPLVVLESLACGMRVVVNELPALIEHLSGTINESGWVEYVKQPRLKNIDQPVENDLPAYCDRLAEALKKQIKGASERAELPKEVYDSIKIYSWTGLVERLWQTIQ
ncbi:glycosyltransferase family 4 protein [Bacillus benzoevorans]|uniref:Glycosyltransferase involved in cell wall biosynthesis n=2 Tax=Bacillus benzoevorans TaxID=1456 RepID=A0A7X0LU16_9BACI|nr:glycosyltransferase family 4 protein [Bacillus benzoevorans]MBB6444476.1 glycosyltransferase involved in cell wall biosynthesis [Bacillus benzoevorans]